MTRADVALRLVFQREGIGDCTVACLATLLGEDYEKVLFTAARIHGYVLRNGLSTPNILKVARMLGKPLTALSPAKYAPDEAIGILEVIGDNHVVILHDGSILDMRTPAAWRFDEFFAQPNVRPGKLLVREV